MHLGWRLGAAPSGRLPVQRTSKKRAANSAIFNFKDEVDRVLSLKYSWTPVS
jgi:hypothetical protein